MDKVFLSDEAKKARSEYAREWRRKNPDRVRANNQRYWQKKAAQRKEADNAAKDI